MAPIAIRCGMTAEQYWHGDPSLMTDYYSAYIVQEKERVADLDAQSWMIGQYVMAALNVSLSYAFGDSKSAKPEYPEEPVFSTGLYDERTRKEREEQKRVKELEKQHAKFQAWISRLKT